MSSSWSRLLVLPAVLLAALACGRLPTPATQVQLATQPPGTLSPSPEDTLAPQSSVQPPAVPTTVPSPQRLPSAPPLHHAGDAIQLDEIHMADAIAGWGLSGADVLVTADGGLTWREATPPQSLASRDAAQASGYFADAEDAWVVFTEDGLLNPETTVWRTSDAGRTWSPSEPLSPQVIGEKTWAELTAADSQHLWLMARGVYVGAGTHYSHELFRSEDGGATWASLDGETSDDFTGLVFADGGHGLLAWQTVGAYAEAPPEYAVTSDGGASWETRSLPPPPGQPDLFAQYPYCESYQPTMPTPSSLTMLVGCFDYQDPPQDFVGFVYDSQDGGANWTVSPLPKKVRASESQMIHFDDGAALLLGREMFSTADGGKTWTPVKSVGWDGQFSFVDPLHGWAVATSGGEVALVHTVNGGRTWSEIKPRIAD